VRRSILANLQKKMDENNPKDAILSAAKQLFYVITMNKVHNTSVID
jgi:hypothetical protein